MNGTILLVGCGKMGGALLRGWLRRGIGAGDVHVVDPVEDSRSLARELGVSCDEAVGALPRDVAPGVVVFAVKPQITDGVVPAYAKFAGPGTVFLSIAAGRSIAYFEERLGEDASIVRTMPNTPAAIGHGISVACANGRVDGDGRSACDELLAAVGEVAWVEDEGLLDAVTATSGSGPAYVFLLVECLAEAGVKAGLPPDLAMRLARATVAGAGELARVSEEAPSELRRNVTSPGGTTAAALDVLMADDGMGRLLTRAVVAATRRSRELAG